MHSEPEMVFADLPELSSEIKEDLLHYIQRRLTPQAMKIRADIEVNCFAYEGVEAVKHALTAGEACRTEKADIKIKLVAPPLYVMVSW